MTLATLTTLLTKVTWESEAKDTSHVHLVEFPSYCSFTHN